ncbi:S41 family peptidase [Methylobacterium sp. P31]
MSGATRGGSAADSNRTRSRTGRRSGDSWIVGLAALFGAIGVVVASPASRVADTEPAASVAPPYRDLAMFGDALHAVRTWAVEARSESQLIDAAIGAMVASLDSHSRYLTAAEFRRLDEQDTGSYAGIGVEVEVGGTVRSALPDAPAARAGLVPGTVIERVDGIAVESLGRDRLVDHLRGEPGSALRLRVLRPTDRAPTEIVLTREWLPLHPVRLRALGTVGYVGLDHFDEFTTGRLLRAVANLKAGIGSGRLTGFVLDLRGNPGGLIVQAIAVAGAFLGHGEIVRLVGRGAGQVERFALDRTGADLIDGLPLVVLVDGGTASAAEIVAGALQDHRRATIIGTHTYGKGAVQTTYAHRDGRGLRLTTAWVVTPAGRRIEGNGIEPDRVVPREDTTGLRDNDQPQGRSLPGGGSLQSGTIDDTRVEPAQDPQLGAALRHLQSVSAGP